ncbi:hypothetical protein GCM10011583_02530 [Streptomyces camponoticapitis]|uniref:DUF3140 domain-containing protein n=1 Tax=Streptomyces camponoticapitis TaxID=1616125 RepID=A0ABQ2DZA6_9ACTN|nr:DUF3140 domain-containing protein [Streptomyces camponoticapitis]GGJ74599.1 hypothetical protein GCM10011583_02530 [Streptomyces camponoticapitis]
MAGMSALELETLWTEFHGVVNMTSQEIGVVLQADGDGESEWTSTGLRVLEILQKRRSELTEEDTRVMYDVVERVEDFAPGADGRPSRDQLMRLGHDPLRSAPEGSL